METWAQGDFNGRWRVAVKEQKAQKTGAQAWNIDFKAVVTLLFYTPDPMGRGVQELVIRVSGSVRSDHDRIRLKNIETKPVGHEKIAKRILMWSVYEGGKDRPFRLPAEAYQENPRTKHKKRASKGKITKRTTNVRSLVSRALK